MKKKDVRKLFRKKPNRRVQTIFIIFLIAVLAILYTAVQVFRSKPVVNAPIANDNKFVSRFSFAPTEVGCSYLNPSNLAILVLLL